VDSSDGGTQDDDPSAPSGLMCDRCGQSFPVQTFMVTAQAEVLCRACFDVSTAPTPTLANEPRRSGYVLRREHGADAGRPRSEG